MIADKDIHYVNEIFKKILETNYEGKYEKKCAKGQCQTEHNHKHTHMAHNTYICNKAFYIAM